MEKRYLSKLLEGEKPFLRDNQKKRLSRELNGDLYQIRGRVYSPRRLRDLVKGNRQFKIIVDKRISQEIINYMRFWAIK